MAQPLATTLVLLPGLNKLIKVTGGTWKTAAGLSALLSLAACDVFTPVTPSPVPPVRPDTIVQPEPVPTPTPPVQRSDESLALSTHYQRVENDLVARGLLRTDGGGPDTTFTDTILARNFVRIALFNENTVTEAGEILPTSTISTLRRWEQPVRFAVEYGATIPDEQREKDSQNIQDYISRLNRVSGHPMSLSDEDPNFYILMLNEDDRLGYEERLRQIAPSIDDASLRALMNLPRDTLCVVLGLSRGNSSAYSKSIALIRGEHPDLTRLACIHEEIAQGLGLANDSPQARPSIFNDDEEFGLLTTHDELLLKMLYDDRFTTSMAAAQAAPIARRIATELLDRGPS